MLDGLVSTYCNIYLILGFYTQHINHGSMIIQICFSAPKPAQEKKVKTAEKKSKSNKEEFDVPLTLALVSILPTLFFFATTQVAK
jgi:hypothetical protein